MPGTIDLIVAGLIAIAYPIWDTFGLWPRWLRTIASGRPEARIRIYSELLAVEWGLTAVIAAVWIRAHRPWQAIGMVPVGGWRLVLTAALLGALVLLLVVQVRAIRRLDAAKRARVRTRHASISPLIPRNAIERAWFFVVSLTAGFCEEFIYRGFLVWAFRPWLGLWGAALVSTVGFAAAHSYQGRAGAIRAGVAGALFMGLAIATGSIIPGMAVHALLDVVSGESSYAIFADEDGAPAHARA